MIKVIDPDGKVWYLNPSYVWKMEPHSDGFFSVHFAHTSNYLVIRGKIEDIVELGGITWNRAKLKSDGVYE